MQGGVHSARDARLVGCEVAYQSATDAEHELLPEAEAQLSVVTERLRPKKRGAGAAATDVDASNCKVIQLKIGRCSV